MTATNIHLSWAPPPEGTHQGVIRSYKLNVTELATDVKFSNDTENTQFVLDSLHPFYIYEIIIIAVTVEEGSNYTTVVVQTSEAGRLYCNNNRQFCYLTCSFFLQRLVSHHQNLPLP